MKIRKGVVKLVLNGMVTEEKHYKNKEDRDVILSEFGQRKAETVAVQIVPFIRLKASELAELEKKKIKRPPAIYTNIVCYEYQK
jgi:hypothetical protein